MSEGLLKKQINDYYTFYNNRDITETAFGNIDNKTGKFDEDTLTPAEMTLKILDEAAREIMPKTIHMITDNPKYNFGHGKDYPRLICVREDEFLQMVKGFKKWFGEVEAGKKKE